MNLWATNLLTAYRIGIATTVNRVIFYTKRIPAIGSLISDRIYADRDLKMTATVIIAIATVMKRFITKALIIAAMVALPITSMDGFSVEEYGQLATLVFFFVFGIAGSVQVSGLLETNRNKYFCIKLMHFSPRDYVIPDMLAKRILEAVYYLPAFLVLGLGLVQPFASTISMWLMVVLMRFINEGLQLFVYDKTGFLIPKKYWFMWVVIIPACAVAYVPVFMELHIGSAPLASPIALGILAGLAAVSIIYILRYPRYQKTIRESVKLDDIMADVEKYKGQARFRDVQIKDSDIEAAGTDDSRFSGKKGYAYLNAIFFARHRRMIGKPVYMRLAIIAGALVVGILGLLFFGEYLGERIISLSEYLPVFVFVMYFMSVGERICRAMFFNCDMSLLRYGFYRKKDVILANFKIRLKRVAGMNLLIGAAICISAVILSQMPRISETTESLVLFCISILALCVFFSVHHLFLYYVFQPYTTELGMKNPYYKVINAAVYLACFMCLYIDATPAYFAPGVICATLIYIAIALICVYRYAPRTFKVK